MASIHDWASKAAQKIVDDLPPRRGEQPRVERIAAIIATFAEPLLKLLAESRRAHHHEEDDSWYCCGACAHECDAVEEDPGHEHDDSCCVETRRGREQGICDCGASAWNTKVDAALAGKP